MTSFLRIFVLSVIACYCIEHSSAFQPSQLSRRSFSRLLASDAQVIDLQKESSDGVIKFNTDVIIPSERWNFADDIFLITTTAKDSVRLEKTKEQLEKVNMMKKVKIRTFAPDDEDRVRGETLREG